MARPKIIEDNVLLDLIKKYFNEECHNNIKKLKTAEIVKYINNNGYPDYPATTLRRTKVATDYIEELKKTIRDEHYTTSVSYQTIDAALLVDSNRSRDSLIKAISERDCYYKTIADSAAQSFERYNNLKKQYDAEKEINASLTGKITELEELIIKQKSTIKVLTNELNASKSVIETYIYPEIANELLVKEGAIRKTDSFIKEASLDDHLITSTTDIRKTTKSDSSVIEGLFKILDE